MRFAQILLLMIFILAPLVSGVGGTEIISLTFDDFNVITIDDYIEANGNSTAASSVSKSYLYTFPEQKVLMGLALNVSGNGNANLTVLVNGQQVFSSNINEPKIVEVPVGINSDSFDVRIILSANGTNSFVRVYNGWLFLSYSNVKAKFVELDDGVTGRGLSLRSELLVSIGNEGALKMSIKWNGNTTQVTNFLSISDTGEVIVNGQATGLKLQKGYFQELAVTWTTTKVYVVLQGQQKELSISGITLSSIGKTFQAGNAIIDNLIIYNSFVDPEFLSTASGKEAFIVKVNGKIIRVFPDGGDKMPFPITVSFYANNTLIGSTLVNKTGEVITAPSGADMFIISSQTISEKFYTDVLDSDVAFPAQGALLVSEQVSIVPYGVEGYLVVKNDKGQIVYTGKATENTVVGISGKYYYLKFISADGSVRATGWYLFDGSGITLVLSTLKVSQEGTDFTASYENRTLRLIYTTTNPKSHEITITVRYLHGVEEVYSFNITESVVKEYVATFNVPEGADTAVITLDSPFLKKTISVVLSSDEWAKGAIGEMFPEGFLLMLFGIGGLLLAPARYKYLSPVIALFILSMLRFIGLIDVPNWLYGAMVGLSVLSMIIYRPQGR